MEDIKDSSNLSVEEQYKEFDNEGLNTLFQQGILYYRRGRFESAIKVFGNITEKYPKLPEPYVNLGNAYFKIKDYEQAINCWKIALSIDSSHIICYVNIGNAFYTAGEIEEAISYWHKAVTIAPNHTTSLINLAVAYEDLSDLSNAFKYYELYLKYTKPNNSTEYSNIYKKVSHSKTAAMKNIESGVSFQKKGELRKATVAYLKAIKYYPNFSKAHLNMGSICYILEEYGHAVKYWLRAVFLEPDYPNTYCNLAVVYEKLGSYDNAYCMYHRFIKLLEYKNLDYHDAVKRMEHIKTHFSDDPVVINEHLLKADQYYKKKKYNKALWEYENFLILDPSQTTYLQEKILELKDILDPVRKASKTAYEIALMCIDKQRPDRAYDAFKRYLFLEPEGEHVKEVQKFIDDYDKMMIQRRKERHRRRQ